MFIRRTLLIIGSILVILLAGVSQIPSSKLAWVINQILPQGWSVTLRENPSPSLTGISLVSFGLQYKGCPLLYSENLKLSWSEQRISLKKAYVDYACLALLPKSEEKSTASSDTIKSLFTLLPQGEADIGEFHWLNLPEAMSPRLKSLLATPSQISLRFFEQKLTAKLQQQAVDFSAEIANLTLNAEIHYQPNGQERHQLQITVDLDDKLLNVPPNAQIHYQWQIPNNLLDLPDFQQGRAELEWQKAENDWRGKLRLHSEIDHKNQLTLPFRLDEQSLHIEQAKVDWDIFPEFPLKAFVSASFTPNRVELSDDLFPIKTAVRISLLSQSEKGKGNIVISNPQGELQKNSLNLPLQLTGDLKYQNFILYSAVPLELTGEFDDLRLRFLQGALLRVVGKERFLTIHELRFPLAGVSVGRTGINGRLQAIFRGESPDFQEIEMRLDGYARHFKGGALAFFDDPKEQKEVSDQWHWRFWGRSQFKPLHTKLNVAGRGKWQQDRITLGEFLGNLARIQQNGVTIPHTELKLTQPITFDYDRFYLNGGIKMSSPKMAFSYGGELEQPTADLTFNGETENLNLKGEVSAGKLGPIRIFARRELRADTSQIKGRLYWSEQPANVFQSLFPFRNHWVITSGTIKGETAFSANQKQGLVAGGHFSIKDGGLSLPNGEIKGISFSLPYQYKNSEVDVGVKKPLEVNASELNLGVKMRNLNVKIHGHYPYSKGKPLFLQALSLELLGGRLTVDRFALPQTKIAYLRLNDISFEEVLNLAQYHQLKLSGRANANFPFWLNGKPCYICNGTLTQAGKSTLRFSPELMKAIRNAGYTEQILSYMVNDSELNELNANIELASDGEMWLDAKIHSQLREHQNSKINLNYTHKENMFELWQLINYGSRFEQQIEHSIYQRLDNK